jgi:hypothetical protein
VKREKTLNPFPRKEKLLLPFPTLGSRRDLVFGDRLIDVINDFKGKIVGYMDDQVVFDISSFPLPFLELLGRDTG